MRYHRENRNKDHERAITGTMITSQERDEKAHYKSIVATTTLKTETENIKVKTIIKATRFNEPEQKALEAGRH
ncbi:DNA internalization-related competence protein ComEC/Rec2 [Sesbania bispinosa]|nr:DNA internalization-related competence protein ComEC/Rec2 [Sesbania bispinosa]